MLWVWCIFGLLCLVVAAPPSGDTKLTSDRMVETITSYGYTAETHNVTTADGYILGVYRIPYTRYQNSATDEQRPVVFCMHGLYGQSQNFIVLEPELAFGFNLADAGFDVWFGNARGNMHSRAHVTLNPDDPVEKMEFFDFSWEEIAIHDLPAMIDYVLEVTGSEKLHYIGHSQGGTTFLVLGSMRPEYNDKMASVHLLAGVGYQEYFPNEELNAIARFTDIIYEIALSMGLSEFSPELVDEILAGIEEESHVSRADLCFGDIRYRHMCQLVGARHIMRDAENDTELQVGGGSLKQLAHYGQNIRDKLFRRFDYGTSENQEKYGDTSPPLYDLSLITSNVDMHYTVNDDLLDERDVLAMAADMPNTIVRKVARETFEHSDFVVAEDAKELVTDYIIESINNVHYGITEDSAEVNPDLTDTEESTEIPDSAVTSSLNLILKSYLILCTIFFLL